jgi:aspartate kinase
MLVVQKFGGTSVGSPERIQSIAKMIAGKRAEGHDLVVVVSAMGQTTDELIELAGRVSKNPPDREMDMLLTSGERIAMALLSMALSDLGVPALSFTGSQSGIITNESHRRAKIKKVLGDRLKAALSDKKVAIVAGFQGVSETREITTLGRGGSDTTAVALASALGAELCEIYTDVDGIFSGDPRKVGNPRFYAEVPWDWMAELATLGAGVLHPRCVELAMSAGVNLVVRNSFNEGRGTKIRQFGDHEMERFKITAVTADEGKMLCMVELARATTLGALWESARASGLPMTAPSFSEQTVRFFTDRDGEGEWKAILSQLAVQGFVRKYTLFPETVPLSLVGHRFAQDSSALCEMTELLARDHIGVSYAVASALSITLGIPFDKSLDALELVHKHFVNEV